MTLTPAPGSTFAMPQLQVSGHVTPGYEPVRALFQQAFEQGLESEAQLCVYVDGQLVLDLWGQSAESSYLGTEYSGDSLQNVFSSTKNMTSLCVASLVDKGLLDYDEKVCHYWPEFGQHGKQDLTLANILRHEGGLVCLDQLLRPEDLTDGPIKANVIGKVIEGQTLSFPAHTDREYHGLTRGWILNEVFRRVEPEGRTLGQYLRQEIAEPLGADAFIGLKEDEMHRVIDLKNFEDLPSIESTSPPERDIPLVEHKHSAIHGQPQTMREGILFFNRRAMRLAEIPSANGSCSARGLAKMAACIVNGGQLDGVRVLSKEALLKMQDKPVRKVTVTQFAEDYESEFTQGGVNVYRYYPDPVVPQAEYESEREGYVGWTGLGGSVFQWNPEFRVAFAFVPTQMHLEDSSKRGAKYQSKLMQCIRQLNKESQF